MVTNIIKKASQKRIQFQCPALVRWKRSLSDILLVAQKFSMPDSRQPFSLYTMFIRKQHIRMWKHNQMLIECPKLDGSEVETVSCPVNCKNFIFTAFVKLVSIQINYWKCNWLTWTGKAFIALAFLMTILHAKRASAVLDDWLDLLVQWNQIQFGIKWNKH